VSQALVFYISWKWSDFFVLEKIELAWIITSTINGDHHIADSGTVYGSP
jgi:hypothetical protein